MPSVGRVLTVLWEGGGNVSAFLGLAGQLLARGHRVGAVATGSLQPRLEGAGVEFVAPGQGWLPGASEVGRAVARFQPDLLVVDYMLTAALCGAERSDVPTAALVHTLYLALLVDGAPHPMGMAGSVGAVNEVRSELGLPHVARHADLLGSAALVLVTAPRELDAAGSIPSNVVYTGALLEGPGADAAWAPPPGDQPLVVVSLGTAGEPDRESELLARIFEALGPLPVRVVVNLPAYIDPGTLAPPANVLLSGYVHHAAVLPHTSALVTHAGLGSVVAALAHGVPMVCLPLGRDQPENAEAVARIGAGSVLAADATAREISAAVGEQLARPDGERVRFEPDPLPALVRLESLLAGPS